MQTGVICFRPGRPREAPSPCGTSDLRSPAVGEQLAAVDEAAVVRFGDLRRRVAGVSEKVLIQHLRELTAAGVLTRRDHHQVPPVVDYTITPFGMTLGTGAHAPVRLGYEHRAEVEAIMSSIQPIPGAETRSVV